MSLLASVIVALATLVFSAVVLGVVGNTVSARWQGWTRRRRTAWAVTATVTGAIAITGIVITAQDSKRQSQAGVAISRGVAGPAAGTETNVGGWYDADGHRPAIEYRDEYTPWADSAGFNCLIGTRSYGDERSFFDARQVRNRHRGAYETRLPVRVGDHIIMRVYVHNCADSDANKAPDHRGDLLGSRVRIVVPNDPGAHLQVFAFISATNARPAWVADGLDLVSDSPFTVSFVAGSGRLYANRPNINGSRLADTGFVIDARPSPIGAATTIGALALDGKIDADGFESELVIQVEAVIEEA